MNTWLTDRKKKLIEIFNDTQRIYEHNKSLSFAVQEAKTATRLYEANSYPKISDPKHCDCMITVTNHKTFEAAMKINKRHPDWKISVLNFASATNPGGGVLTGSSAQEESLCRCSTLYPTLTQDWLYEQYYEKNRKARNNLHTDACIYSPGVVVFKTDDEFPVVMKESDWINVDVISCAAPNLRRKPGTIHNPEYGNPVEVTADELYRLHTKRAEHILHIAAVNAADALVLGAFGCGAFANDPEVVARAYNDVLKDYKKNFKLIEFAVYCRPSETENYDAFKCNIR